MLIIRKEQVEQLRQAAVRDFKRRARKQLRRDGHTLPDSDISKLDAFFERAIAAAKSYGITIEYDVYLYAIMMLRHGPTFDLEADWAHTVLTDETLKTGSERAGILYERSLDHISKVELSAGLTADSRRDF